MKVTEYRQIIDRWTRLVETAGIVMSDGKPVPVTFWKTFLGIKRRVHQGLYNGTHSVREGEVMTYVARSMAFASLLPSDVFLKEVERMLPEFESDKVS